MRSRAVTLFSTARAELRPSARRRRRRRRVSPGAAIMRPTTTAGRVLPPPCRSRVPPPRSCSLPPSPRLAFAPPHRFRLLPSRRPAPFADLWGLIDKNAFGSWAADGTRHRDGWRWLAGSSAAYLPAIRWLLRWQGRAARLGPGGPPRRRHASIWTGRRASSAGCAAHPPRRSRWPLRAAAAAAADRQMRSRTVLQTTLRPRHTPSGVANMKRTADKMKRRWPGGGRDIASA